MFDAKADRLKFLKAIDKLEKRKTLHIRLPVDDYIAFKVAAVKRTVTPTDIIMHIISLIKSDDESITRILDVIEEKRRPLRAARFKQRTSDALYDMIETHCGEQLPGGA